MVSGGVFGNMTFSEGVLGIYPGGWGWSFKCLGGITEACPGGVEQNQEACPRMVLYIVPGGGRGGVRLQLLWNSPCLLSFYIQILIIVVDTITPQPSRDLG